ncbi:MAG: hypothetical protein ABSF50_06525 [Burkholderiaceae bacterium]|jgi:uncharacterized membrane protein YcjF (UPF0283 family)
MTFGQSPNQPGSQTVTPHHGVTAQPEPGLHTREEFEFVANAPLERCFPLFGAAMERVWAEDWHPKFSWPSKAEDREGMVFEIAHGEHTATWVNTVFDLKARRIQYVYTLPDFVATVITIDLIPRENSTLVKVRYERTSLSLAATAHVSEMAEHDRRAGPEWAAQINRYLTGKNDDSER